MNSQRCCSTHGRTRDPQFPRTRITPTFVHEHIFEDLQNRPRTASVRFTPTFHATMLDDVYQSHLIDTRYRPQDHTYQYFYSQAQAVEDNQVRKSTVSVHYKNDSQLKKQEQLHQGCGYSPSKNRRDLWYDTSKENMLKKTTNCNTIGISRQRKLIELSSEPLISDQDQRYHLITTEAIQNQQDVKVVKYQKTIVNSQNEQVKQTEQSKKNGPCQAQNLVQKVKKDQKPVQKVQLKNIKQPATKNQKSKKLIPKRPQSCQLKASNKQIKQIKGNPGPIFRLVTKNRIK